MRWDAEVAAAVKNAGRLYEIAPDTALVHAIIEKETRHGALPITGTLEPNGHYSYGPMQVEDDTAAAHGISDPTTLAVPSIGIRIGTYELARLLAMFPDDPAAAIAAYNGGPGIASRGASGQFPNQGYVDAVTGFWNRYRGVAVSILPVLGLAVVVFWFLAARRRRAASR